METTVTLPGLCGQLRLPRDWLRDEALAGRIPCLKIGGKLLFNVAAVEAALLVRAGNERILSTAIRNATGGANGFHA